MGPNRLFSEEQERAVGRRYEAGESIATIAADLGVGTTTVNRTLRRIGVAGRGDNAQLDEATRAAIVEAGRVREWRVHVAKRFSVAPITVTKLWQRHGVAPGKGKRRALALREDAFDAITPESAYWMGFLVTDGCLSSDGTGAPWLAVNVAEKDREHLVKLLAFLGSGHAVTAAKAHSAPGGGKGGPAVGIKIRSRRLVDALAVCGMVPGKPKRVPCEALVASRDFWRGAIDGDGWLGVGNYAGYLYPHVGFCGQAHIVECLQRFLAFNGLTDLRSTITKTGIYRLQTTGATAAAIIRVLYDGATVVLERKRQRAASIIAGDIKMLPSYGDAERGEGHEHAVPMDDGEPGA